MKLNLPKILETIDLVEYAPELAGQLQPVWVNPPRSLLITFNECRGVILEAARRLANPETVSAETPEQIQASYQTMYGCLVQLWSQGPEETHWTMEEIKAFEGSDTDPMFLVWLTRETMQRVTAHRQTIRKVPGK